MKKIFNTLCLNGHGLKVGEKLRIWWFSLTLVVMGSVDDASWWVLMLLLGNLIVSAASMMSISKKLQGKEKEEI